PAAVVSYPDRSWPVWVAVVLVGLAGLLGLATAGFLVLGGTKPDATKREAPPVAAGPQPVEPGKPADAPAQPAEAKKPAEVVKVADARVADPKVPALPLPLPAPAWNPPVTRA